MFGISQHYPYEIPIRLPRHYGMIPQKNGYTFYIIFTFLSLTHPHIKVMIFSSGKKQRQNKKGMENHGKEGNGIWQCMMKYGNSRRN